MALIYLAPLSSRATKGGLLAFLCGASGIEGKRVGKIELQGSTALVEIPDDWEARLVTALDGPDEWPPPSRLEPAPLPP